jgi:predicted CoA-binding protein
MTDDDIRRILADTRTIAVVGWSPKPDRPSHRVAAFLKARGYRVIPVNPGQAGQQALGETVRASLADIGEAVDMVDIFRRSEEAGAVVDDALAALPGLKTVWMQLDVVDEAAAGRARAQGVEVVMNRCPAIEIPRLGL